MKKTITIIKRNEKNIRELFESGIQTDMIFRELQKDTIGRSGSNPTWGYVYSNSKNGKIKFNGIALHKEYDYDFPLAAYAEKAWCIFGKELLEDNVRVPFIEVVEKEPRQAEILSYRIMDNNKEDMIHIKDTLFNKFERDEMKQKRDIYTIEELLECLKIQVGSEENYKRVEKAVLNVLLLDCVTNNGDRHAFNWALVRNKEDDKYDLAVFDHSGSFANMLELREYYAKNGWSTTYVNVDNKKRGYNIGSGGKEVTEYISSKYPEYFQEFSDKFINKLPKILDDINREEMKIDFNRLSSKMIEKKNFLIKLRDRGERDYE